MKKKGENTHHHEISMLVKHLMLSRAKKAAK